MPLLSIILIAYDMAREVPRTVFSLLPPYQQGVSAQDIDIIVIDNGSAHPIPEAIRKNWLETVRYHFIKDARPSPAHALNFGAAIARGTYLCPMIDGARMASPGLVAGALSGARLAGPRGLVATLGLHLGPDHQARSAAMGYDQAQEDCLLDSVGWQQDGYRLFEIAALAGSAKCAWFGPLAETNAPVLSKTFYEETGGFEEAFDLPGGGLVNLDFFNRALAAAGEDYVLLLGEATFHQFHGGVTTSKPVNEKNALGETEWERYARQYAAIRGKAYATPPARPILFGRFDNRAARIAQLGLQAMTAVR